IGRRVEPPPSLFGGRLSISIPHHFFAQCEQTRHVAILFRRSRAAIISLRPWSLEIKVCHFRPRARWLGGGLPVNVAGPCVVVSVRQEYPGRCRIVGIARTAFLCQIKRYLPEVALAQSSRRGSITLPKLRIALGIQADDEPNRWSVASVPKQFAEDRKRVGAVEWRLALLAVS